MQRAFDRLDQQENRTQWKWTAGIVAAFGLIMFALVALTWTPAVTSWISDAAQAELASSHGAGAGAAADRTAGQGISYRQSQLGVSAQRLLPDAGLARGGRG